MVQGDGKLLDGWLACEQPRLHGVGSVAMLVFTAFVTTLSLDMYTPALPQMVVEFASDEATLNATMLSFYILFAIGQLVFGPISDSMGRRPLLLAGSLVYAFGSAACALANSVLLLVIFRMIQAIGAGSIAAISIAMVKDLFAPEKRDLAFSVITSLFGIAPVVAPFLGALLLTSFGWRSIFWALVVFGCLCAVFALLLNEPLSEEDRQFAKQSSNIPGGGIVAGLVRVLKNPAFSLYMTIAALFSLPFMAYVAVASHIYVTFFGLTEVQYGIFFGIASVMMIVGPFLWPIAQRIPNMNAKHFTTFLIVLGIAVGIALIAIGWMSPVVFCAVFALFMLAEASVRPFTANILLTQQETDIGAAAALTNCSHSLLSTIGMAVAVLPWLNFVFGLGVITVVAIAISGLLWVCLLRSKAELKGVDERPAP